MFAHHAALTTRHLTGLLAGSLLVLVYAAQTLRAQDVTATEDPVSVVLTETPLAESQPSSADAAPLQPEQPTLVLPTATWLPTDVPATPTIAPTETLLFLPSVDLDGSPVAATDEPLYLEPTLMPGTPLEATGEPTGFAVTPMPTPQAPVVTDEPMPEQIVLTPDVVGPTAQATIEPTPERVIIVPDVVGPTAQATIEPTPERVIIVPDVVGPTAQATIEPTPERVIIVPDVVALTNTPAEAEATAESTPERVIIVPDVVALTNTPAEAEATAESTPERLIDVPEFIELTPEALDVETTAEPVLELVDVTPEATTPALISEVTGQVTGLMTSDVQILWDSPAMQQRVSPQADGAFSLWLLPGVYRLTVTAPRHLPYTADISIEGERFSLTPISLTNGDIDGSGHIDAADVDILVTNYGLPVAQASYNADLNDDGLIDLYDLAILGANLSS
jgi:hypothetical protein